MNITPIFSAEQIQQAVQRVAEEILQAYGNETPVMALCLLNGGTVFAADLIRHLPCNFELETVRLASYEGTHSTGVVHRLSDLPDCKGKHVLVIDDLQDTGLTLQTVYDRLCQEGAASVKSVVALTKDGCNTHAYTAEFSALHCENLFLIGYGLDYNGKYRNLPYIGYLATT